MGGWERQVFGSELRLELKRQRDVCRKVGRERTISGVLGGTASMGFQAGS